jgi:hypothetical protein
MRKLLFFAVAIVVAACGKSEQTVSYKDSEGVKKTITSTKDGNKQVVKTEDGKLLATGTQGGSTAVFHPAAPQYPGSRVTSSVDMPPLMPGGRAAHVITQSTSDSQAAVVAFYKTKASAAGMPVTEQASPTGTLIAIGKPDKIGLTDLMITVSPSNNGVTPISTMQYK